MFNKQKSLNKFGKIQSARIKLCVDKSTDTSTDDIIVDTDINLSQIYDEKPLETLENDINKPQKSYIDREQELYLKTMNKWKSTKNKL